MKQHDLIAIDPNERLPELTLEDECEVMEYFSRGNMIEMFRQYNKHSDSLPITGTELKYYCENWEYFVE